MRFTIFIVVCTLSVLYPRHCSCQNFNVDISEETLAVTNSSYGAAGLPGTWNTATQIKVPTSIVDILGQTTTVILNISGFRFGNQGGSVSDDEKLMGDMLYNDWDVRLSNLADGFYFLYIYACAHSSYATGPVYINDSPTPSIPSFPGISPAQLKEGTSWVRTSVTVTGGNLRFSTDSSFGGIAGFQLATSLTASPTTAAPTLSPSTTPTSTPTSSPTSSPTRSPSTMPTSTPTSSPTSSPTRSPSAVPTSTPTPTSIPSSVPTQFPSLTPSANPTVLPSSTPTSAPSAMPSKAPSSAPGTPTASPSTTVVPTNSPTFVPTANPSVNPTGTPSTSPTLEIRPSVAPSRSPTMNPTATPSMAPSQVIIPSVVPPGTVVNASIIISTPLDVSTGDLSVLGSVTFTSSSSLTVANNGNVPVDASAGVVLAGSLLLSLDEKPARPIVVQVASGSSIQGGFGSINASLPTELRSCEVLEYTPQMTTGTGDSSPSSSPATFSVIVSLNDAACKLPTGAVVGIIIGGVVLALASIVVLAWCHRRQVKKKTLAMNYNLKQTELNDIRMQYQK